MKKSSRKRPASRRVGPAVQSTRPAHPFPVVGIGASAGGLDAFLEFLRGMACDTGMAFVLVQHLAPDHQSVLAQLLAPATAMPVRSVADGMRLAPNHVYVIPPGQQMTIADGALHLEPRATRPSSQVIDRFLQALADSLGERSVGIILSGTASDGTLGLEAVKAAGGITFAQDASARFQSMPRSAVAAGCVDFELSPAAIAAELARLAPRLGAAGAVAEAADKLAGPAAPDAPHASAEVAGNPDFHRILALLRRHSGVDFSVYKPGTMGRRVARRMTLGLHASTSAYADALHDNPRELEALLADMLISVTGFFRNPDAFELVQQKVFRRLLREDTSEPVRVWVLGCSTGQEPFSLAMLFAEEAQRVARPRKLQVFATDLNEAVLEKARAALYAPNLVREVSPERLRQFFTEEEGGYRITKALRDEVVFARQNALNDPPFSRLDLISCRNVLIYVDAEMQKRMLPLFHFALKPGGVLFLGASESIGTATELFGPLDGKHRLFTRKPARSAVRGLASRLEWHPSDRATRLPAPAPVTVAPAEIRARREADRLAASRYAPPGVVVDAAGQILQFRGETREFLNSPPGRPNYGLFEMLQEGMMVPLRAALARVVKEGRPVSRECRRLDPNGQPAKVLIHVAPLLEGEERCFLVMFESAGSVALAAGLTRGGPARGLSAAARRDRELVAENQELRERLRQLRESAQNATEELQASNEEVTSANEELQSINEEMETSKEEIESTNEELTTVNEELAHRNGELSQLNADLRNFHASIVTPIIFVDTQLVIRRITPQATEPFNVHPSDLGRSIASIRHHLVLGPGRSASAPPVPVDLEAFLGQVVEQGAARDWEVRDREGNWHSLRIRPYLTADGKVEGAVLVLVDIDALKRSEAAARGARDFAEAAIRTLRDPFIVLSGDLQVNTANDAFFRLFATTASETSGRRLTELANPCWSDPRLHQLLSGVLRQHQPFNNYELTVEVPHLGRRRLLLDGRRLRLHSAGPELILLAILDLTDWPDRAEGEAPPATTIPERAEHEAEERLRENRDQLARELSDTQQLQAVSALLVGGERVMALHEGILDAGIAILRADFGTLELCDDAGEPVRTLAQRGMAEARSPLPHFPPPADGRHWREAAASGNRVLVADLGENPAYAPYRAARARALQATPLLSREGKMLGVFSTYWSAPHQPAEGSLRLFDILARQAADLIERQVAAKALQQSEGQYRALFAAIDEGFAVIEVRFADGNRAVDYRFDEVNPSFAVQTGIRGAVGRWMRDLDPHHEPHWFEIFGRVALTGEPVRFVNEASGLGRWLEVYAFRPEGLGQHRVALLVTDVTARRGISRDLERVRDEAVAASGAKDDFLAALSHELRTPLTPALLLAGDAAANKALPPEVRRDFESIQNSINLEARLIDDLLDLTRVARGKLKLEMAPCDLGQSLQDALGVVRWHVAEKKLVVTQPVACAGPVVHGDAVRLQQVFWNVLRNAIYFTPPGGRIDVSCKVDTEARTVCVDISDTGAGIAAEDLERIFAAFTQADTAGTCPGQRRGGLGLGLAISSALVHAHGGTMRASSPGRGQGSCFHITLPLAKPEQRIARARATDSSGAGATLVPPPRGLRILVVDDHKATCAAFRQLLERRGHVVASAGSIEEAMLVIERSPVDVLLSDIGLPDGDGYQLMERVRQVRPDTIGIAASGYGTESDVAKSLASGFQEHLTKPIGIVPLEQAIARHYR